MIAVWNETATKLKWNPFIHLSRKLQMTSTRLKRRRRKRSGTTKSLLIWRDLEELQMHCHGTPATAPLKTSIRVEARNIVPLLLQGKRIFRAASYLHAFLTLPVNTADLSLTRMNDWKTSSTPWQNWPHILQTLPHHHHHHHLPLQHRSWRGPQIQSPTTCTPRHHPPPFPPKRRKNLKRINFYCWKKPLHHPQNQNQLISYAKSASRGKQRNDERRKSFYILIVPFQNSLPLINCTKVTQSFIIHNSTLMLSDDRTGLQRIGDIIDHINIIFLNTKHRSLLVVFCQFGFQL